MFLYSPIGCMDLENKELNWITRSKGKTIFNICGKFIFTNSLIANPARLGWAFILFSDLLFYCSLFR